MWVLIHLPPSKTKDRCLSTLFLIIITLLSYMLDDEDDLHDEEHIDEIDPLMDDLSPDDRLTPLERVEKYFQSEDMGDRDMANRIVPEALQTVENLGQFELLLEIAFALANDHGKMILF